ncbi:MAG: hypothetical protein HY985_13895 [Magnetospirillum sp.]|nr:hypothetical protein [Magnetospirillum sp.]
MATGLRFAFTAEGHPADGAAAMTVTYVGRISRRQAEADARRRFEEWSTLANPLVRRWSATQVVVS